jgi:hypothetical protein
VQALRSPIDVLSTPSRNDPCNLHFTLLDHLLHSIPTVPRHWPPPQPRRIAALVFRTSSGVNPSQSARECGAERPISSPRWPREGNHSTRRSTWTAPIASDSRILMSSAFVSPLRNWSSVTRYTFRHHEWTRRPSLQLNTGNGYYIVSPFGALSSSAPVIRTLSPIHTSTPACHNCLPQQEKSKRMVDGYYAPHTTSWETPPSHRLCTGSHSVKLNFQHLVLLY